MSVKAVRDALMRACHYVYHYKADPAISDGYVEWGETGVSDSMAVDDTVEYIAVRGEIYYYTKVEFDPVFDDICRALSEAKISWRINEIGYDDLLGQIVYGIDWEVPCGKGEIYR